MVDHIYDYDGPSRVCHEGHVYYNSDIMRESYDLPDLEKRDRTTDALDDHLQVIVSGGSMSGLFTAIAIHQAGHKITVYEKTEHGNMKDRGAGIIAHPEMLAYLEHQGIAEWDDISTFTTRIQHLNRNGVPIDTEGRVIYTTSWDTVYRKLREALPNNRYRMGERVADVEHGDRGVTAIFENGERETGDLLVAAEGYRSTIREKLLPGYSPEYVNYLAFRGVVAESHVPRKYEERFGDIYNIFHAPNSQFLTYPVPGSSGEMDRGSRRINWVWYYPVEDANELSRMLLDNRGTQRSHSLPPGLMREEIRQDQINISEEVLPEQLQWIVSATQKPFIQCIYDLSIPQLVFNRVCLLGDAAFFIRPHMAAGTAHAAADALSLAESIHNHDELESALTAWEPKQIETGYRLVEEARRRGDRYTGQF